MFKKILYLFLLCFFLLPINLISAEKTSKTILFIPHDNRPISFQQTADNIRCLGYEVITPPEKYLGNRTDPQGNPDKLAEWATENIKKADAAVISSDALIYGSLVASRKHNLNEKTSSTRAEKISKIHKANMKADIYIFGSIMRTPHTAADSGGQDDEKFINHVEKISAYTALSDKQEQDGLDSNEKTLMMIYKRQIPPQILTDWLSRRQTNFKASKKLIDLLKNDDIQYLVLGCDDNAKYSQTHKERRLLDKYAGSVKDKSYYSVSGIDEIGYILLMRAVNHLEGKVPFVSVRYANGVGEDTVPAASNEPIKHTIATQIRMAGGMQVRSDEHADLVFMVNTANDGSTGAANDPNNIYTANENTKNFIRMVQTAVNNNKPVGIGDIVFGNGADNSLMYGLYQHQLLDKLNAYSGWNTPTNSTGYALAMGMGAIYTDRVNILKMLEVRYLDDWLYQSNVRQYVANRLDSILSRGEYNELNDKKFRAQQMATAELRRLIKLYGLDEFEGQSYVSKASIEFPWNRMYEAAIIFPKK